MLQIAILPPFVYLLLCPIRVGIYRDKRLEIRAEGRAEVGMLFQLGTKESVLYLLTITIRILRNWIYVYLKHKESVLYLLIRFVHN